MSTQENFLTEIANAIRAKGGITGSIAAKDFAKAIRNLPESGGGGGGGGGLTAVSIINPLAASMPRKIWPSYFIDYDVIIDIPHKKE